MQYNRKKTRKLLFQKLYSMRFAHYDEQLFQDSFYEWVFQFSCDDEYITEMIGIILEKQGFFVEVIKKYSPKFDITKMNIIYVLPIYIALAEMFFLKEEIPGKVSINEAVEIAKVYGDNSSKRIVNWVLNKVLENSELLEKIKDDNYNDNYQLLKKKVS